MSIVVHYFEAYKGYGCGINPPHTEFSWHTLHPDEVTCDNCLKSALWAKAKSNVRRASEGRDFEVWTDIPLDISSDCLDMRFDGKAISGYEGCSIDVPKLLKWMASYPDFRPVVEEALK